MGVTVFTKNRERLLNGDIAVKFLNGVLNLPRVRTLLSRDHFTVDGTRVEAWASMKSFKRKPDEGTGSGDDAPPPTDAGRNAEVDFHGETRSNATHASTPDPEARLYRKGPGQEAKLRFLGHALMENRHGLFVDTRLTLATGAQHAQVDALVLGQVLRLARDRPLPEIRGRTDGVETLLARNLTKIRASKNSC